MNFDDCVFGTNGEEVGWLPYLVVSKQEISTDS